MRRASQPLNFQYVSHYDGTRCLVHVGDYIKYVVLGRAPASAIRHWRKALIRELRKSRVKHFLLGASRSVSH